jgi:hypothetical protein
VHYSSNLIPLFSAKRHAVTDSAQVDSEEEETFGSKLSGFFGLQKGKKKRYKKKVCVFDVGLTFPSLSFQGKKGKKGKGKKIPVEQEVRVSIRCPEESESSPEDKRSKLSKARRAAAKAKKREDIVTARAKASPPREQKKVVPVVSRRAQPSSSTKLDDPEPTQVQSVIKNPAEVTAVPVVAVSPLQTRGNSSQTDTTNTSALDDQLSSRTLFKKPNVAVTQSSRSRAQSSGTSVLKQVGVCEDSYMISFSG